jgi:serine/threonine-protein kinase
MEHDDAADLVKQVGRYMIFREIAAGGMATVHLARMAGPVGFSRVVAVKRLHPHLVRDPELHSMFIDEARVASRIRHPNVVPLLDVVAEGGDIYLVMEYVEGEALGTLQRGARQRKQAIPLPVILAVMADTLQGLHAAHEARDERRQLLGIVHRDVSPQNILVGLDGAARILDFGVAKALGSGHDTRPGVVKGKSSYMAPEQIRGEPVSRQADIFSASAVLWELVTSQRLFAGSSEHERMYEVLRWTGKTPPSTAAPHLPEALDHVLLKGLAPDPAHRYATALEMAEALQAVVVPASLRVVGDWVATTATESITRRAEILRRVETTSITSTAIIAAQTPVAVTPRGPWVWGELFRQGLDVARSARTAALRRQAPLIVLAAILITTAVVLAAHPGPRRPHAGLVAPRSMVAEGLREGVRERRVPTAHSSPRSGEARGPHTLPLSPVDRGAGTVATGDGASAGPDHRKAGTGSAVMNAPTVAAISPRTTSAAHPRRGADPARPARAVATRRPGGRPEGRPAIEPPAVSPDVPAEAPRPKRVRLLDEIPRAPVVE